VPLPKSTHREYIAQDSALDFVIRPEDMAALDAVTVD
jgi:hypothetical protein